MIQSDKFMELERALTSTETFIRDAIAGGWWPPGCREVGDKPWGVKVYNSFWFEVRRVTTYRDNKPFEEIKMWPIEKAMLDVTAWKAVGKARGWTEPYRSGATDMWTGRWEYLKKMRGLVDALAEEKTIEEYLTAMSQK